MKVRLLLPLAIICTLGCTLLYVRSRLLLVELSYQVAQKISLKRKLEENRKALQLEMATLRSPERIEKYAAKNFQMRRSLSSGRVVVVNEDRLP